MRLSSCLIQLIISQSFSRSLLLTFKLIFQLQFESYKINTKYDIFNKCFSKIKNFKTKQQSQSHSQQPHSQQSHSQQSHSQQSHSQQSQSQQSQSQQSQHH